MSLTALRLLATNKLLLINRIFYSTLGKLTRIEETFVKVLLFSVFFPHIITIMVLHHRPGAGGGSPVRTGCSGNCPTNRLISSEVLLPPLRSNYGAHLDSLTTKRRELARMDLWQVVIRWRLFLPRGTSILATSVSPSAGARNPSELSIGLMIKLNKVLTRPAPIC